MPTEKIPVIAVSGPTASGKSAAALHICKTLGGELISCDSMQIYRRMDIGTAKPTREEMAEVSHHMIDILDPTEDFSAADFALLAAKAIEDIHARRKLPVLCGGTGLYLDSLLKGVDFGEFKTDPAYREALWSLAKEKGNAALHDMLRELDPEAADAIHMNNVKRVIRALEICKFSGMTKTEWDKAALRRSSPYAPIHIALDYRDREVLYHRIDLRVDEMIETGLLAEVQTLLDEDLLRPDTTAWGAIGYKELLGFIRGEISLEKAVSDLKLATRHYAKRQLTWLRRNESIRWFYPDEYKNKDALMQDILGYIKEKLS